MTLFDEILIARGLISTEQRRVFLQPDYDQGRYDSFLLPDMRSAVNRLVEAHTKQEKITVYGDYDIDGLTATTVLLDAFESFGFQNVSAYIPNRFVEGYGLTIEAVEKIAKTGSALIITVDCGSLSEKEITRANELGVDVIVTDHHNVLPVQPPAVAVINPKRLLMDYPERYEKYILNTPPVSAPSSPGTASRRASSRVSTPGEARVADVPEQEMPNSPELYPFLDLPGVGVAFKLVQALQTKLGGLEKGQEKWLLDLVALGTVCDIVSLQDENRMHVYWGLKVLAKTRRPGLRALMAVAGVEPDKVNARSLGFGLGPRLNAAGRLETAEIALKLLRTRDKGEALELAGYLDDLNQTRRAEQNRIFDEAVEQAEQFVDEKVLVLSGKNWSHGIIGIVAAKLLEKYKKPTFVLEEMGDESKGSARSYGDFSAADAIRSADDLITKGGGHKMAAGVTLETARVDDFRKRVNQFYQDQGLINQQDLLLPRAEVEAVSLADISEELVEQIARLEPFGNGNPQPIIASKNLTVIGLRRMGSDAQHVKLDLRDSQGSTLQVLAFNAPEHFFAEAGIRVNVWYQPDINEWNGKRSVEGRLLRLEST